MSSEPMLTMTSIPAVFISFVSWCTCIKFVSASAWYLVYAVCVYIYMYVCIYTCTCVYIHVCIMCCTCTCMYQARSKPILIGQAILYCNTVRVRYLHMSSRGGLGACSPRKLKKNYTSLDAIWYILDKILL